jgi:hypothetical protein
MGPSVRLRMAQLDVTTMIRCRARGAAQSVTGSFADADEGELARRL